MDSVVFSRFTRYFLEVARQGSLRKAAEVLHVSASAIDRQILMAEENLDTVLFERHPGGLKLTAGGELLLGEIRRSQKEYQRVREQLDELRGLKRGHVTIAMIDALSDGFLPRLVSGVGQQFPHLGFDLAVMKNAQVVEVVSGLDADMGLLLDPYDNKALDIRARVEIPIGVAVPTGHPLAEQAALTLTLTQTLGHRHILAAAPLMIHQRASLLYAQSRIDISHAVLCNDVRAMRSLIRGNLGIGILSWLDVAEDVARGDMAFIPLAGRHVVPLTLALCVAPRRQLSKAAQLVIGRIAEGMQALALPLPQNN